MRAFTVLAPAKINLGLAVGGPRADGFHGVATLYHAVSICDEVTAAWDDELSVVVEGEQAGDVPVDGSNLAIRAARLLAESAGVPPRARLQIRKRIPVAGGMAGGSADAAAALLACDALWETHCTRATLRALAARLGSDVPFALMGGNALGTGRGSRLTPALGNASFHWVLAAAPYGLSTPAVYAETDRLRRGRVLPEPRVPDAVMAALRAGDQYRLGPALFNDLQPAACSLRPELRLTLEVGEQYGALGSLVSGSGPTCAFLARDQEHALELAVALDASGTCRAARYAYGPVAGARIVTPEGAPTSGPTAAGRP